MVPCLCCRLFWLNYYCFGAVSPQSPVSKEILLFLPRCLVVGYPNIFVDVGGWVVLEPLHKKHRGGPSLLCSSSFFVILASCIVFCLCVFRFLLVGLLLIFCVNSYETYRSNLFGRHSTEWYSSPAPPGGGKVLLGCASLAVLVLWGLLVNICGVLCAVGLCVPVFLTSAVNRLTGQFFSLLLSEGEMTCASLKYLYLCIYLFFPCL